MFIRWLSRQLPDQSDMGESASFSKGKTSGGLAEENYARRRDSPTAVNKFTLTKSGGLPPNPNDTLQNESMQTNEVTTETPGENSNGANSSANPNRSVPGESNVPKTAALLHF